MENKMFTALKFIGIVLIFVIISAIVSIVLWLHLATNATYTPDPENPLGEYNTEETLIDIPRHTNVFIAGVDAETGSLTDFMMVGTYDRDTSTIDFINIPRDTECTLTDEQRQECEDAGIYSIPTTMKLNALHSYTKDMGMDFLTSYMEDLLGIDIGYYALVNLDVLQKLIDAMGGVWFDVPQRMYYNDNSQDLHIDLQEGYQLLDADQCEQLLRYRHGYAQGDLKRIEVQQDFLKAMMEQLLTLDTFLDNPVDFTIAVFGNIETNATPLDLAKYVQEIPKIQPDNINFYTAPMADVSKYVYLDEVELDKLVDELFYDIVPEPEIDVDSDLDSESVDSE